MLRVQKKFQVETEFLLKKYTFWKHMDEVLGEFRALEAEQDNEVQVNSETRYICPLCSETENQAAFN